MTFSLGLTCKVFLITFFAKASYSDRNSPPMRGRLGGPQINTCAQPRGPQARAGTNYPFILARPEADRHGGRRVQSGRAADAAHPVRHDRPPAAGGLSRRRSPRAR